MKTLKEQMAMDNQIVFFNPHEFGEAINFNGIDVIGVKEAMEQGTFGGKNEQGLVSIDLVLHLQGLDLPRVPSADEMVTIDGKKYLIKTITGQDVVKMALQKVGAKNAYSGGKP